jgi:CubicO group peptidase (beta-lactamase class C family)
MALQEELSDLQGELESALAEAGTPGAVFGVWRDGDTATFATGLLNTRTGVEVTPDSVFQIGSITKLFTATLVMQLVDAGKLELDVPLKRYLPEFAVGDFNATETVTVRHLLTHTSGIDGDFFQDTGRGDDCLERYLLACSTLPQLHTPGEGWSYCNAGFVILGRLIERLTGDTWDRALRERLTRPIGARSLLTLPEDVLTLRSAAGHFQQPNREQAVIPVRLLPRSNGPAGATAYGAVSDLFAFAKMHCDAGRGLDGQQVLSSASVMAMRQPQHTFNEPGHLAYHGLGWVALRWGNSIVFGHDGGTLGQVSFFRVVPEKRLAVALFTNGGQPYGIYARLFGRVFTQLAGIDMPPLPAATEGLQVDGERYSGTYRRLSGFIEVQPADSGLSAVMTQTRGLGPNMPPRTLTLQPIDDRHFLGEGQVFSFDDFDGDGRPRRLSAVRMYLRAGSS